jgi:cytidylate kinase
VVTIDGPAGAGKSTVAKLLAKALGVAYLDTGATYRALAFAVLQGHPDMLADEARLALAARFLPLQLKPGGRGTLRIFLSGVEITRAIRSQEISEAAAQVSQYPAVRAAMVAHQRKLAGTQGVVVEGRDTGSVVFPDARYKFFLDADLSARAERRQQELLALYGEPTPMAMIRQELHFRDLVDQSRPVGRLVKPRGAVVIDTTHLTAQHVVRRMLRHVNRARRFRPS